jgi:hypothetical protein
VPGPGLASDLADSFFACGADPGATLEETPTSPFIKGMETNPTLCGDSACSAISGAIFERRNLCG